MSAALAAKLAADLWFFPLIGFPRDLLNSLNGFIPGRLLFGPEFGGFFLDFEELAIRIRLWRCLFHVQ